MCFRFWQSESQQLNESWQQIYKPRVGKPPHSWNHCYTGVGATFAVLLNTTVAQLGRTVRMDLNAQMMMGNKNDWNDTSIMSLCNKTFYNSREINAFIAYKREKLIKHFDEQFKEELKYTPRDKHNKLLMKLRLGVLFKQPRVDPINGAKQEGHVMVLGALMKQGELVCRVLDYYEDPQGKDRTELLQDEDIAAFWCLDPNFYHYSKDANGKISLCIARNVARTHYEPIRLYYFYDPFGYKAYIDLD